MGKFSMIVGACVATSLMAAAAHAGTVTLNYTNENPYTSNLKVAFNGVSPTSSSGTLNVGEFNWTVASSPAPVIGPSDPGYGTSALNVGSVVKTFCIEGTQYINNPTNFTLTTAANDPNLGTEKAAFLTELWGRNQTTLNAGPSATFAAAFQLAVWEIVYDGPTAHPSTPATDDSYFSGGTFNSFFNTGNFRIYSGQSSDSAVTTAISLLNSLTGTYTTSSFVLGALTNSSYQDQITAFNTPGVAGSPAVPLPAALPVGGAMLGAMGLVARFRKRNRA